VEKRLACRSGRLPDDLLRLGVEAMAAASFAMGIAGLVGWFLVGLIYARRRLQIWHTGLARGITNGHCHRPCIGLLSYYFPWE